MSRVGVFVCHCGENIAGTVDVAAVTEAAQRMLGVAHAQHDTYLCSDPGQELIRSAIAERRLTGVVVAACSPRMHEVTFRRAAAEAGLNPYLVEMANICDKDYEEWDLGYRLYVGGRPVVYHVDCIEANWDTRKVKNIVAQDRGFRRRIEGERETANELKVRAQLYRFVIGSVLDDALADHSSQERAPLFPVGSLTPVSELEIPVSAPSVGGLAGATRRDAARPHEP